MQTKFIRIIILVRRLSLLIKMGPTDSDFSCFLCRNSVTRQNGMGQWEGEYRKLNRPNNQAHSARIRVNKRVNMRAPSALEYARAPIEQRSRLVGMVRVDRGVSCDDGINVYY